MKLWPSARKTGAGCKSRFHEYLLLRRLLPVHADPPQPSEKHQIMHIIQLLARVGDTRWKIVIMLVLGRSIIDSGQNANNPKSLTILKSICKTFTT